MYLIPYAAPVTKNMLHFGGLTYYTFPRLSDGHVFPSWLPIGLGILGARLYLSFSEYTDLMQCLGFGDGSVDDEAPDRQRSGMSAASGDMASFLLEWLTVRRKGQDILHTPMGYVCHGRSLGQDHAFFATRHTEASGSLKGRGSAEAQATGEEESDSDHEDDWGEQE